MAVYFKISQDGKKVIMARTLFEKELSQDKFDRISKEIDLKDFVEKLPQEKAKKIMKIAEKVKKLNRIPITKIGVKVASNPITRTTHTFYFVGDKVFCEDYGDDAKIFEKEEAAKYANEFYGVEFMKKCNLMQMEPDKFLYVQGNKEMGFKKSTEDEYEKAKDDLKKLSSIISLKELFKSR